MKMNNSCFLATLVCTSMLLSACSNSQYATILSSSSVGGMLGSSIGGVMNGPRGADKGTIAGMVIGGAVGAAVTTHNNTKRNPQTSSKRSNDTFDADEDTYAYSKNSEVQFDSYNKPSYNVPKAATSDLQSLEVSNLHFIDANNNRKLDNGEKAYIVFDIYNRGNKTLYNVAPNITCSTSRVVISAPASVAALMPNQGIRYKAEVVAVKKVNGQTLQFTVSFGKGKQQVVAQKFSI